jgi:hypothetical protein
VTRLIAVTTSLCWALIASSPVLGTSPTDRMLRWTECDTGRVRETLSGTQIVDSRLFPWPSSPSLKAAQLPAMTTASLPPPSGDGKPPVVLAGQATPWAPAVEPSVASLASTRGTTRYAVALLGSSGLEDSLNLYVATLEAAPAGFANLDRLTFNLGWAQQHRALRLNARVLHLRQGRFLRILIVCEGGESNTHSTKEH